MAKTADVILEGLEPTGRRIGGPGFDLVEGKAANGLKHLALVHHAPYLGDPLLTGDLQPHLGFMEGPDVAGIVRLASYAPETAAFAYPTGTVWPVCEVVRTFADLGAGAGVKAGLELCYQVAELLTEAARGAQAQGLPAHGNLSPWTVVIKGDGQPLIIGYGVPPVALRAAAQGGPTPSEDAFRYAAPERLEGDDEDLSTDLFALALIALELMMGRPVYDGLVNDIRQQASRGEGMRRLYQWRERIPDNVREVLGRALKPDPDTRYRDGADFVYELHDLLGSLDVDGPSLVEVMAKVRALKMRGGRAAAPGESGALSTDELREIAADLEVFDDSVLPPPRVARAAAEAAAGDKPRWTRAKRSDDSADESDLSARERLKRRLRSGRTSSGDPARPSAARDRLKQRLSQGRASVSDSGGKGDRAAARERLKRRLGRRASPAEDEPAPTPTGELPELDLDPDTGQVDEDSVSEIDRETERAEPEPEPEPADDAGVDPTEAVGASAAALLRQSAAAELLEKLRSSDGRSRRRRRRRSSKDGPPSDPDPPPEAEAPEPEPEPEPEPDALEPDEPDTDEGALESAAALSVTLTEPPLTLQVPDDCVAATLVRRATADRGRVPIDLSGRLTGWWQLTSKGKVVDASRPVAKLRPPLALVWVPNHPQPVTIEAEGPDGTIHFRSLVGIAVPAGWLAQHLGQVLQLGEGPWKLQIDGATLHPDRILAGLVDEGTVVVVVPA